MPRNPKSRPEPEPKLPIKLGPFCNGEVPPVPLSERTRSTGTLALARIEDVARRLGRSRREFLGSVASAAATLGVMNEVLADEPYFTVTPSMAFEEAEAASLLEGDEFIFDIQTHHVNPRGTWRAGGDRWFPNTSQARCGEEDPLECLSARHYVDEIFMKSDTTMTVLSAVPSVPGEDPLTIEEAAATRELVERAQGSPRIQLHGLVIPNMDTVRQLDGMARLAEVYDVKAWRSERPRFSA